MNYQWEKSVLKDCSFGVPDDKYAELENIKKVQNGDNLFLYVSGKNRRLLGMASVLKTAYKDLGGEWKGFSNRIGFNELISISVPILFSQFRQELFPKFNNNPGNALRGKSLILISDKDAGYLRSLFR